MDINAEIAGFNPKFEGFKLGLIPLILFPWKYLYIKMTKHLKILTGD